MPTSLGERKAASPEPVCEACYRTLKCGHHRTPENRLDEVAGLDRGELTEYRRSSSCVLEARTKEASHGTLCDRSRWKGISNLRAQQRRADRGRAAVSDRGAAPVSGESAPESRRRG